MKALILAAGEGTRLRPLTLTRPKPMIPVGDRPLLEHTLNWLREQGITEIGINLHYLPHTVMEHLGDGSRWGVNLVYSVEPEILGTAGGAKALEGFLDETFVVIYGDLLTRIDLVELFRIHREMAAAVTVGLYQVPNPWECGLVELAAPLTVEGAGRIIRFVEKPPRDQVFTNLANAGVYVMEPSVLQHIPENRFYDFGHDLFPDLLEQQVPMAGCPVRGYLLDIGSHEKLAQAQRDWAEGRIT